MLAEAGEFCKDVIVAKNRKPLASIVVDIEDMPMEKAAVLLGTIFDLHEMVAIAPESNALMKQYVQGWWNTVSKSAMR